MKLSWTSSAHSLKATLSALLLVGSIGYAQAITYGIDLNINSGGVTGSISTNDTIGILTALDITGFKLVLNDGGNQLELDSNAGSKVNLISGNSFTATASNLLFNFDTSTSFVIFQKEPINNGLNFFCLATNTVNPGVCGFKNIGLRITGASVSKLATGITTIGTVSAVPVPAALPLFGTGLALMGFIGWHRKHKLDAEA